MPLGIATRPHTPGGSAAPLGAASKALPNDEAARVRLAAKPSTPAAVLRALADDPAVTVRAAVAMNPCFAPDVDRRLASDCDERVRALLGGKVAALLPGLSGDEHTRALAHVNQTLAALARDAAVLVRVAIAEALNAMPEAPRDVILMLAQDPVLAVSDPVLRLSPLLTDADLMALLAVADRPGIGPAVASRAGLSEAVAELIAVQADSAAIASLLRNPSASIQEATLDALVGRAGDHPEWHEPLVCRPTLPARAARALARIVAGRVLEALAGRADLDPTLAEELRIRLTCGLDTPAPPTEAELLDEARRMQVSGGITEQALLDAAAAGEYRRLAAMLAVGAGVPLAMLDRAVGLRNAKALVSLVWKAGFSMKLGRIVQGGLGRIEPSEQLTAMAGQPFPLSADEMDWQIELLAEPGR